MSDKITCCLSRWTQLTAADFTQWRTFAKTLRAAPDLQPEWALALVAAHDVPAKEVLLVKLVDGGKPRAFFPLRVFRQRRSGIAVTVIQPLLSIYSLHFDILTDLPIGDVVPRLLGCIDLNVSGWTVIELMRLVEGDPLVDAWRQIASQRTLSVTESRGDSAPYLEIDSTRQEYLAGKSGNFRSNIKRKQRRLESQEGFAIDFYDSGPEISSMLNDVASVEERSWKSKSGSSWTTRPWEASFYRELIAGFGHRGQLLVSCLRLGGAPIAYDLSILGPDRAYCLKTSFDSNYEDLSPGFVLRNAIMHRMFEKRIREYDFLGKNERYKLQWSESVRNDVNLSLLNVSTWRGSLTEMASTLSRLLKASFNTRA